MSEKKVDDDEKNILITLTPVREVMVCVAMAMITRLLYLLQASLKLESSVD